MVNIGNSGNLGNTGNLGNMGNLGGSSNGGNLGNSGDIGNLGNTGNLGNRGNIENLGNRGNLGNSGNVSNVGNTRNLGNSGNIGILGLDLRFVSSHFCDRKHGQRNDGETQSSKRTGKLCHKVLHVQEHANKRARACGPIFATGTKICSNNWSPRTKFCPGPDFS